MSNIDIVFVCRNFSGTLKCQEEEVKELRFFSADEIPKNISKPLIKVVQKWIDKKAEVKNESL